jgi:electron transfer flavoprotein alpha subunit
MRSAIAQPLHVLLAVEPTAAHLPQPHVSQGRLLEPRLVLSDADRAALETALQLRDQAQAPVTLEVAAVAKRTALPALREALRQGADRARLIVPEADAVTADCAAAALAYLLKPEKPFDLILFGDGGSQEEGLLGRLLAANLGMPALTATRLGVQSDTDASVLHLHDREGRSPRQHALPAAVGLEAGAPLRSYRMSDALAGLAKNVEVVRWPKKMPARELTLTAQTAATASGEEAPQPLAPAQAAQQVLDKLGLGGTSFAHATFEGSIEDVAQPVAPPAMVAVIAADAEGRLQPSALAVVKAARLAAAQNGMPRILTVLLAPVREELQRRALGQLRLGGPGDVVLVPTESVQQVRSELFNTLGLQLFGWDSGTSERRGIAYPPLEDREAWAAKVIIGEPWAEPAFAALAARAPRPHQLAARVRHLVVADGELVCETSRANGKLAARRRLNHQDDEDLWISLAAEAELQPDVDMPAAEPTRVQRWRPSLERFFGREEIRRLLKAVKQETGLARLADADFIIDVGYGVGNRDGYEAVVEPLERTLRELGVRNLVVGGSRKVTEELHLLPPDRQIGQSGVSVNPQVLLALGVSGAPQHLNYIGPRATILAFNRDPEAPLLTLNARQPRPRVFPVIGDLFETVPVFITALQEELSGRAEPVPVEIPAHSPA